MTNHVCIIIPTNKKEAAVQPLVDEISRNTPEPHKVIATCQPVSCSCNRNYGLKRTDSELFVMMDDDMSGFYPGWLTALIRPLISDAGILVSSARLLGEDGKPNRNQGMWVPIGEKWPEVPNGKVAGACFASKMSLGVLFEERFRGGGYEDTCWMLCVKRKYPNGRIVVSNDCKLVHKSEVRNQGGEIFEHNKKLFMTIHPEETGAAALQDWTKPGAKKSIWRRAIVRIASAIK